MSQKIAERLRWAVETLNVQGDEHILEIGCGYGVAVSLICDRLTTGRITALDRSGKMIEKANERNSACIEAGKARFLHTELDEADFDGVKFDKIFAAHVNVFWMQPAKELAVIHEALKPNGRLYLFYQPLDVSKTEGIAAKLIHNLQTNSFCNVNMLSETLPSGLNICVTARTA